MALLREAARSALGLVVLLVCACDRGREQPESGTTVGGDTGRAIERSDPELTAMCDTVHEWLRLSVGRQPQATYGRFTGSVRGTTRYGCQFAAVDTLPPDPPMLPLDRVWEELAARGWSNEPAYTAEGPEGRMGGVRRGSILCVLQHYWDVGSDDERAAQWVAPARYDARIECFREAPRRPSG